MGPPFIGAGASDRTGMLYPSFGRRSMSDARARTWHPFRWTKDSDKIIATVRRGPQALNSFVSRSGSAEYQQQYGHGSGSSPT
jgi:hypothetical protein